MSTRKPLFDQNHRIIRSKALNERIYSFIIIRKKEVNVEKYYKHGQEKNIGETLDQ